VVVATLAKQQQWAQSWAYDGEKSIYSVSNILPEEKTTFQVRASLVLALVAELVLQRVDSKKTSVQALRWGRAGGGGEYVFLRGRLLTLPMAAQTRETRSFYLKTERLHRAPAYILTSMKELVKLGWENGRSEGIAEIFILSRPTGSMGREEMFGPRRCKSLIQRPHASVTSASRQA